MVRLAGRCKTPRSPTCSGVLKLACIDEHHPLTPRFGTEISMLHSCVPGWSVGSGGVLERGKNLRGIARAEPVGLAAGQPDVEHLAAA